MSKTSQNRLYYPYFFPTLVWLDHVDTNYYCVSTLLRNETGYPRSPKMKPSIRKTGFFKFLKRLSDRVCLYSVLYVHTYTLGLFLPSVHIFTYHSFGVVLCFIVLLRYPLVRLEMALVDYLTTINLERQPSFSLVTVVWFYRYGDRTKVIPCVVHSFGSFLTCTMSSFFTFDLRLSQKTGTDTLTIVESFLIFDFSLEVSRHTGIIIQLLQIRIQLQCSLKYIKRRHI